VWAKSFVGSAVTPACEIVSDLVCVYTGLRDRGGCRV